MGGALDSTYYLMVVSPMGFEGQQRVLFSDIAESHCWVFVLYCDTTEGAVDTVRRTSQFLGHSVSKWKK